MNTLARNFSHTFRRFFTASVLNIIGLAIAFASFFVIMTQVDYDLNFNKGYKDYQNIYRVEVYPNDDNGWQTWTYHCFIFLRRSGIRNQRTLIQGNDPYRIRQLYGDIPA